MRLRREREERRTDKTPWQGDSGQTGQDIWKMPLRYYGNNNVSTCPVPFEYRFQKGTH